MTPYTKLQKAIKDWESAKITGGAELEDKAFAVETQIQVLLREVQRIRSKINPVRIVEVDNRTGVVLK